MYGNDLLRNYSPWMGMDGNADAPAGVSEDPSGQSLDDILKKLPMIGAIQGAGGMGILGMPLSFITKKIKTERVK